MDATTFEKEIRWDRETHDFNCYLNGEYVGSAPSYLAGEELLNALVYEQLAHAQPVAEVA